jgi:hypothetical protein
MVQPLDTREIAGVTASEQIVREFPMFKSRFPFWVIASIIEKQRLPSFLPAIVPTIFGVILIIAVLFLITPRHYSQVILTSFRIIITQQKHTVLRRSFSCKDVRLSEIVGAQLQMNKKRFSKSTTIVLIMESGDFFDFASGEKIKLATGTANPLLRLLLFPIFWLQDMFSRKLIKSSEITDDIYCAVLEAKSKMTASS